PASGGTSTSRPRMANRIAVNALTIPATPRMATISTMPDQRENRLTGLGSYSITSNGGSSIESIIHQGLEFFIRLHARAVREIRARNRFTALGLNGQNFQKGTVTANNAK